MQCCQYIPKLGRKCLHMVSGGYRKCYQHRKPRYPRPKECPVCTYRFAGYYVPLHPCQHWVCPECIVHSGKDKCPLCRAKIKVPVKDICMFNFYARSHEDHDVEEITSSEISEQESP